MNKIGFMSITKTSCCNLLEFLLQNYEENLLERENFAHVFTTESFSENVFPVCTVRDPVERFISMYNYYFFGSEIFGKDRRKALFFKRTDNIYEFIDSIIPEIYKITHVEKRKYKKYVGEYIWRAHINPQTHWIKKQHYYKTIITMYQKNMTDILIKLGEYLHSELNFPKISKLPTHKKNVTSNKKNFNEKEMQYIKDFVNQYYSSDYELIKKIEKTPNLFKAVIK